MSGVFAFLEADILETLQAKVPIELRLGQTVQQQMEAEKAFVENVNTVFTITACIMELTAYNIMLVFSS